MKRRAQSEMAWNDIGSWGRKIGRVNFITFSLIDFIDVSFIGLIPVSFMRLVPVSFICSITTSVS